MRYWHIFKIILASALFFPILAQATPFTLSNAYAIANNVTVQHTYTTLSDGTVNDSIIAFWKIKNKDGTVTDYCSITLVSEFLNLITGDSSMLTLALIAPTPNGWLVSWNSSSPPPNGINSWCIQQL